MRWGKIANSDAYVNAQKNILLRQTFAAEFLTVMAAGKVIINFDKTTFQNTNSQNQSWIIKGQAAARPYRKNIESLHLFLAACLDGKMILNFF
jgi:hypothetical protein